MIRRNMLMNCPVTVEDIKTQSKHYTRHSFFAGQNDNKNPKTSKDKSHNCTQKGFKIAPFNHIRTFTYYL